MNLGYSSFMDPLGTASRGGGGAGWDRNAIPWADLLENPNQPVNSDSIKQIYQQVAGRAPSQDEIDHFSQYLKTGDLDMSGVAQIVNALPEVQQKRMDAQQQTYGNLLTAGNQQILGQAADAANASFAQSGRQFSSGQGSQVIQAGQQLAAQQSPMIANYYGNNAGNLNQLYNDNSTNAIARSQSLMDSRTNYNRQARAGALGYQMQQNSFQNFYNQQRQLQQNQAIGGAVGGVVGGVGGFMLGGPAGAMAGAGIGSRIGSSGF